MNYGRRTILPGLIRVIRRVTKCRIFVWIFFSDDHNLEMAKLQGFIICCDMSSIVQHCKSYCHRKCPAVIRIIVIDWCGVHWMSCKRGEKEDAGQLKDMTMMTCQQSDHRHHIFTILMIVRGCWSAARCDGDMSQVSSYLEPPRFPHVYTTAPSTLPRLGVIVSSLCKIASSLKCIYSLEIPQVVPNRKPGSELNWLQIQMRGTNPT